MTQETITSRFDIAARVCMFLTRESGGKNTTWGGKLAPAQQRALFGTYLGRGQFLIDGVQETVTMSVQVCFGTDSMQRVHLDLKRGTAYIEGDTQSRVRAAREIGHLFESRF